MTTYMNVNFNDLLLYLQTLLKIRNLGQSHLNETLTIICFRLIRSSAEA